MSTFISIKSACGKSSTEVDVFDVPLNPDGIVCCDNCESIIASRQSWYKFYKFNPIKGW